MCPSVLHHAVVYRCNEPDVGVSWNWDQCLSLMQSMERLQRAKATRRVEVGDELGFNYNTNEWAMATPFQCHADKAPASERSPRDREH